MHLAELPTLGQKYAADLAASENAPQGAAEVAARLSRHECVAARHAGGRMTASEHRPGYVVSEFLRTHHAILGLQQKDGA